MNDQVQKSFIDYKTVGDTGEDTVSSVAPFEDGEAANQENLRRPVENIRERTEGLREAIHELSYYRDFNKVIIGSDTAIDWPGAADDGGTGIITQYGDLIIEAALGVRPGVVATPIFLTTGTIGSNQVTYEGSVAHVRGWTPYKTDHIFIEHIDDPTAANVTVDIEYGPTKRLTVTFDSTNPAHDTAAAQPIIQEAIVGDTYLNNRVQAVLEGTSGAGYLEVGSWRLEFSGYVTEKHRLPSGLLDAFTTVNPLNLGDTVAIWYRYLVEPEAGGDWSQWPGITNGPKSDDQATTVREGRWESSVNITNGDDTIGPSSLFITSNEPEKIPGSIPICRVAENGRLVFSNHANLEKGKIGFVNNAAQANHVSLTPVNWIASTDMQAALGEITTDLASQGVTSGATLVGVNTYSWLSDGTVQEVFQEIVDDLADAGANNGATRIGVDDISDSPDSLVSASVFGQLTQLLGFVNARGRLASAETWTAKQTFEGAANTAAVRFTPTATGTPTVDLADGDVFVDSTLDIAAVRLDGDFVQFAEKEGQSRAKFLSLTSCVEEDPGTARIASSGAYMTLGGSISTRYFWDISQLPDGAEITQIDAYVDPGITGTMTLQLYRVDPSGFSVSPILSNTSVGNSPQTIPLSPLSVSVVNDAYIYRVGIQSGNASDKVYGILVTFNDVHPRNY